MNPSPSSPIAVDIDYSSTCAVLERAQRCDGTRWLWDGYLAAGNVTLLVGPWKAGKTTLLSVLLARIGTGGTLAGAAVRPSRAVVVSEEGDDLWAERIQRLGLTDQLQLVSRPFRGRPTATQWQYLIDSLIARHQHTSFDLLVVDPLASFMPGHTENDAGAMLDVMLPLQSLTSLGVCVLILHHPRKAQSIAGRSARGTGALIGTVDIILELDHVGATTDDDRRRRLLAFATSSRDAAPAPDRIESRRHRLHLAWRCHRPRVRRQLADPLRRAGRREHQTDASKHPEDAWPADYVKPGKVALWRWLDRALKDKLVLHEGTGRKNHPFRYWLDGMEEVWQSDPFYLPPLPPLEDSRMQRKTLHEVLAGRRRKG